MTDPRSPTVRPLSACLLVAALGLACVTAGPAPTDVAPLALIPAPVELERGAGRFVLDRRTPLWVQEPALLAMGIDERLREVVDPLRLRGDAPQPAPAASGGAVGIRLDLAGSTGALSTSEALGPEGYRLIVRPDGIHLTGATPVGAFYGLQTLRQLLPAPSLQGTADWSVPCCEIVDGPRFPWRGQLLDVSRHFLPVELVKKNLDHLAALKLNVFHWHLTDDQGWRIEMPRYPELTSIGAWRVDRNDEAWWGRAEQAPGEEPTYGGFYSAQEIADVLEYARQRGITVVPEVDMPGHSRATIAAYPEISCDGRARHVATGGIMDDNTYCPGKEVTFEFVEGMLEELVALFPSEFIHIGGDECNKRAWGECADCQARMREEGLANVEELQSYFIARVERMLNARGRRMIGWDEILEGGLAPNATVMSWRGTEGGIAAARAGHDVVMTPTSHCYLDLKQGDPETEPELGYSQLLLSTTYDFEPIPDELTPDQAQHVLGIQGNLWGESIQREEHMNYMLFPRLFAIAEVAWSPRPRRPWSDFMARLEPALARLAEDDVGYAPSLYQVAIEVSDDPDTAGVEIGMHTEHGAVDIRYTVDGAQPEAHSPLFRVPIALGESAVVHAAAFRGGQRLGRVSTREVKLHRGIGRPVEVHTQWSERYPGSGAAGLSDGRRGSLVFSDDRWLGFQGTHLEATLDLGQVESLDAVGLGCLEVQSSWIFYPEALEVLLSEDGVDFHSAGRLTLDATARVAGQHRQNATLQTHGARARFVRVVATSVLECPPWHAGAGGQAWLFVDEILIQ